MRVLVSALAIFSALFAAIPAHAMTSVERTKAALGKIRIIDPLVHAVIAIDPTAMKQAEAADRIRFFRYDPHLITGLPILVKDNIDVAGLPTTAGSLALAKNIPANDAPIVARLRAAHAVILGKTNLSEWANIRSSEAISGWSGVGGQTRNPHALDRSPSGSSSGSAAAVSSGMVEAAIGTETNGSVVSPAAMTGIVGLKPTVGLVSRTGIIPISVSQDTAGPLARSVFDAARLLGVIAGSDPADPATKDADAHKGDYAAMLDAGSLKGARIGVMRFATGFSSQTDAVFDRALATLREQGAVLVEIRSFDNRAKMAPYTLGLLLTEFKAGLNAYLATANKAVPSRSLADIIAFNKAHAAQEMPLFGQDLFERAQALPGLDDPDYLRSRDLLHRLAGPDGIDRLLKDNDVVALIGPTYAPAFPIDAINGDHGAGSGAGSIAAVAGYPHLTVPMGAVKGLPVGLSFIGTAWSEAKLLSFGYAFEQASKARIEPTFKASANLGLLERK